MSAIVEKLNKCKELLDDIKDKVSKWYFVEKEVRVNFGDLDLAGSEINYIGSTIKRIYKINLTDDFNIIEEEVDELIKKIETKNNHYFKDIKQYLIINLKLLIENYKVVERRIKDNLYLVFKNFHKRTEPDFNLDKFNDLWNKYKVDIKLDILEGD